MAPRKFILCTLLLVVSLVVPVLYSWAQPGIGAEPGNRPLAPFKVADPRAGLAAADHVEADNLMRRVTNTPALVAGPGQRIVFQSDYEAVFFARVQGTATFSLDVRVMRDAQLESSSPTLGSDQAAVAGVGPMRRAGSLSVGVILPQPGTYTLTVHARTTARSAAGTSHEDDDSIRVIVEVVRPVTSVTRTAAPSDLTTQTPRPTVAEDEEAPTSTPMTHRVRATATSTPMIVMRTRTPWVRPTGRPQSLLADAPESDAMASIRLQVPAATDREALESAYPVQTITSPSPIPAQRELLVANPRGHLLTPAFGAVDNLAQSHGQTLFVRQGATVTIRSAYEFVWFYQGQGGALTELAVRLSSAKDSDPPLADRRADIGTRHGAERLAGALEVAIPFNEAGTYSLTVRVHTALLLPALATVGQPSDTDIVPVRVVVFGEPAAGGIAGTVTAADGEVPLEGVWVSVYPAAVPRPATDSAMRPRTVQTGADGAYHFEGLPVGDYLVYANPGEKNYMPEWYDDSPTREGADPVHVVANTTIINIDFALARGASISGVVTEDTGALALFRPLAGIMVTVGRASDNAAVAHARTLEDGSYRIEKLTAGRYWVHAGSEVKFVIGEYYDNHLDRADADIQTLTEGQELERINFALLYGGAISGRVRTTQMASLTDAPPIRPSPLKVRAYDWATGEAVRTTDVAPDGGYVLSPLAEGSYRVYAFDQLGSFVPEYYDNVTDPRAATEVRVVRGQVTRDINFTLAPNGVATVEVRPVLTQVKGGNEFRIAIWVTDVRDLGAFEFTLAYSPTVVSALSVEVGGLLSSTGRTVIALPPIIDNTTGRVAFAALSAGAQPGAQGAGVLAWVRFQAQSGECGLNLGSVQLRDTHAARIEARTRDGRVVVGDCILGDFDCDCDVDIADVMQVARRWGTRVGDPQYSPLYDLDHDGDIDIVDLAIVAAAWGNTCNGPTPTPPPLTVAGQAKTARLRAAPSVVATGMRLEPASSEVRVGQPITIEAWVDEALDLGAFEFTVDYDPARVRITAEQVVLGPFLGSTGRPVFATGPQITEQTGSASLRFGALSLGASPSGPDGNGVLALLTFTPIQVGPVAVSLSSAQLTDTNEQTQEILALQGCTINATAGYCVFLAFSS